jgi:pyruvate ferredoxin oxidoreductase delta subunit
MFGPLISKPGSSRKNKTGSWRIEMRPKFLEKDCIGCKQCLLICPEGCIGEVANKKYTCDLLYCKGCGLCAQICPKKDVVMEKEGSAQESSKDKR